MATPAAVSFEMFWAAYPRKVCKKAAEAAWRKISPNAELATQIVSAVYAQRLDDRDRQYIPHPATWLNGERWTDEVAPPLVPQPQMPRELSRTQARSQRNAAAAAAVIASYEAEAE